METTIEFYLDDVIYKIGECESQEDRDKKTLAIYNKEYAPLGYSLDVSTELLRKTFDYQIVLNEGDVVNICGIDYNVIEKILYLDCNEMYYFLSSNDNPY
mgnify:CR=1 FL=1